MGAFFCNSAHSAKRRLKPPRDVAPNPSQAARSESTTATRVENICFSGLLAKAFVFESMAKMSGPLHPALHIFVRIAKRLTCRV